jgi:hypothetical protein
MNFFDNFTASDSGVKPEADEAFDDRKLANLEKLRLQKLYDHFSTLL